jgi:hypothetical protein
MPCLDEYSDYEGGHEASKKWVLNAKSDSGVVFDGVLLMFLLFCCYFVVFNDTKSDSACFTDSEPKCIGSSFFISREVEL